MLSRLLWLKKTRIMFADLVFSLNLTGKSQSLLTGSTWRKMITEKDLELQRHLSQLQLERKSIFTCHMAWYGNGNGNGIGNGNGNGMEELYAKPFFSFLGRTTRISKCLHSFVELSVCFY
ncbi:hypothetical protein RDABS01_018801 [Bienertia sinuspersici]